MRFLPQNIKKKGNRRIFTSFEQIQGLQVGWHLLQSDGFQVGLGVAMVPARGGRWVGAVTAALPSQQPDYSLFGKGKLLGRKQRRLARLPALLLLQHVREKPFDLEAERTSANGRICIFFFTRTG